MMIDGQKIRGYRSPDAKSVWIRDFSDMMRGFKYFEKDLTSTIEHFAETQAEKGRIFDYFTTFPEKLPCERENWTKYVRVPVEADVEYRFVKAAFLAWQAGGSDDWLQRMLPKMDKALHYILAHPYYWDNRMQLVKRPYTIDTWDFAYTAGSHEWLQFQVDDHTFWGIMHGDNSGYYEAFRIMSLICDYFRDKERALYWKRKAASIKENMNKTCWNGKFYTHFVKLTDMFIPGVAEADQLSLSNPMAINRGAAGHDKAVSIIKEYISRRGKSTAFAEWFSIDPPFPDGVFGDDKLKKGAYVNGGIMPLVGGELAKAAFDHGFEAYGVDILQRYYRLIAGKRESYLWYFPDGTPASRETSTSPEAEPTDGWGSSAVLYALLEGLAGIEDKGKGFNRVVVSPRWPAAGIDKAEIQVVYESSGQGIYYRFERDKDRIYLETKSGEAEARFHILLPRGCTAESVAVNGSRIRFQNSRVADSSYVDFQTDMAGNMTIEIALNPPPDESA